ncbi:MAG: ABC transporter permease [Desulfobacteraceae bacterium]
MLKNYFTIAINNLLKNKLYSAINIIGLAVGLSACIVIALYVKNEFSYDKQWNDADRIYRVTSQLKLPGKKPSLYSDAPLQAMPLLEELFKDKIEQSARTFAGNIIIETGTSRFQEMLVLVDPDFPGMFKSNVITGSLDSTLTEKNNIALSADVASRIFGEQNPLGKIITANIGNLRTDYKVTAVYRIQGNTILDVPLISLLDDRLLPPGVYGWFNFNTGSYFKLKDGIDINVLKSLIPSFIDQHVDISKYFSDPVLKPRDILSLDFQKLENAHLDSPWDTGKAGGNRTSVISFAGISLLVLMIGCINFTILTTAEATQRAREVALRKVVGAKRKQLIVQFLGESTFIVLLAIILSTGIVEIMLPVFESIMGKTLSIDYTSPYTLLPLGALLIIVGISGGLYPAFILSGFRPGDILKSNKSKETRNSILFRSMLVVFQFTVSIILIIATAVIYIQVEYSMNRNPGYNKDNLLLINRISSNEITGDKMDVFKQELLNLTDITDVAFSRVQPSQQNETNQIFWHPGHPEISYTIADESISYDYFKTYQIPVIAGRDYSVERDIPEPEWDMAKSTYGTNDSQNPVERNIIINESAARQMGFSNPEEAIGKMLYSTTLSNINHTVIGVVADNQIYSIDAPPRAEVYMLHPEIVSAITIRFKGSSQKILKQILSVGKKVMGDIEISTVLVDQLVAQEFKQQRTEGKIIVSFSILTILIACLGLFGSASFTVERRTREIGLRKVMGAKIKDIVNLLGWNFLKPVLIANVIAWPVAIFAMQSWLERFQYRFNPLLMIPIPIKDALIANLYNSAQQQPQGCARTMPNK